MEIWNTILDDLPGLLTALGAVIALTVNLVKYVKEAVKEKNWRKLVELIMVYMKEAEGKFESGADKKQWVLAMIKASADAINYDMDMEEVGQLIDSLCDLSNVVNPPAEEAGEGAA